MSVNSSSSSSDLLFYQCKQSIFKPSILIGYFAVKTLLILPLCTFILYLAQQQWRQQRSFNTASHSDLFTYHLSVMELLWVVGAACFLCGDQVGNLALVLVGICLSSNTFCGEICFHVLTSVERYLAVVHPVTYRGLRTARGVRIRNVSIGCVWLLCFVTMTIYGNMELNHASTFLLCLIPFSLIIISFCSLSVLCALISPGPGEGGGEKVKVDQVKLRAFHTISAISGVLWVWFLGIIFSSALNQFPQLDEGVRCAVGANVNWLNLPCSLVSPLLYLHRVGKLPCCCNTK